MLHSVLANVQRVGLTPAGKGAFWVYPTAVGGGTSRCLFSGLTLSCGATTLEAPLAVRAVPAADGFEATSYSPRATDAGWALFGAPCSLDAGPATGDLADGGFGDGGLLDAGPECGPALALAGLSSATPFDVLTTSSPGPADPKHLLVFVHNVNAVPELGYLVVPPALSGRLVAGAQPGHAPLGGEPGRARSGRGLRHRRGAPERCRPRRSLPAAVLPTFAVGGRLFGTTLSV